MLGGRRGEKASAWCRALSLFNGFDKVSKTSGGSELRDRCRARGCSVLGGRMGGAAESVSAGWGGEGGVKACRRVGTAH